MTQDQTTQEFVDTLRPKLQVEALLVRMSFHTTKSFSECFGVTVSAPRTDLRTTCNRVPPRIRPFDAGLLTHGFSLIPFSSLLYFHPSLFYFQLLALFYFHSRVVQSGY